MKKMMMMMMMTMVKMVIEDGDEEKDVDDEEKEEDCDDDFGGITFGVEVGIVATTNPPIFLPTNLYVYIGPTCYRMGYQGETRHQLS